MRISDVARRAGVNLETVRFYERKGLLPSPPRAPSGYRAFTGDAVRRVRMIKRTQALGFSLKEIKELLAIRANPDATCADVRQRTMAKLAAIDGKIAELRRMKRALSTVVATCPGRGPSIACPLLDSLEATPDAAHDREAPAPSKVQAARLRRAAAASLSLAVLAAQSSAPVLRRPANASGRAAPCRCPATATSTRRS